MAAVVLVVACVLTHGLSSAQAHPGHDISVDDIKVRDRLIADQEALLNAYRCRFGIDAEVVVGGCRDSVPSLPATGPGTWVEGHSGLSVQEDMLKRDELIVAQEALLNVYRCRFGIDAEVVAGGCQSRASAGAGTDGLVPGWYRDPACRYDYRWWNGSDLGGWSSKVREDDGELLDDVAGYGQLAIGSFSQGIDPDCIQAGSTEHLGPGERLRSLSINHFQRCLLRVDGVLTCRQFSFRGHDILGVFSNGQPAVLSGRFLSVSAGYWHSCGIYADGAVVCWQAPNPESPRTDSALINPPVGKYTAVSAGSGFSCGLKIDQTIACWGINDKGQTDVPTGQFIAVSSGADHSCGVKNDQSIECWGHNEHGELKAPRGRFTQVSAGFGFSCALKSNQTIVCWGSEEVPDPRRPGDPPYLPGESPHRHFYISNAYHELDPPPGRFTAVATSDTFACGLRVDSAIVCWGATDKRVFSSPDKEFILKSNQPRHFVEISAGESQVCGVRADGSAECYNVDESNYSGVFPTAFRYPTTGQHNVVVHYCTSPNSDFTETNLRHEVDWLNRTVSKFYFRESSGAVSLNFIPGDIVNPELPWENPMDAPFIDSILVRRECSPHVLGTGRRSDFKPREDYLVLVDHPRFIVEGGFADSNLAVVFSRQSELRYYMFYESVNSCVFSSLDDLLECDYKAESITFTEMVVASIVAHEIGHAVFDFPHPFDCSIMGHGYFHCPSSLDLLNFRSVDELLDARYVGCRDRRFAGWPEDSELCREPLRVPTWE